MIKIKAILAYLLIIGAAVLYTLFLESKGGCYLIIALVIAAFVSVCICLYTKTHLSVSLEVSEDILNRNEYLRADILLKKTGFLPSAFISTQLSPSYHFTGEGKGEFRTAMIGASEQMFSCEYKAEFFGVGRIVVNNIIVSDYLGLCSFRLPVACAASQIKIYPVIPEVSAREGLARTLTDSAVFDETEETTQTLYAINGTPGYEHRRYEPGDSLKLINWKLSAKRRELLVRRLEGATGAEQIFILDKAGSVIEDMLLARSAEQLVVEALLGMLRRFAESELPSKLMIRTDEVWETIPVLTMSDISDLKYRLTGITFSENAVNSLPQDVKGRIVVFTARCDQRIASFVNSSENHSAAADRGTVSSDRIWIASRDNDDIKFTRI